MRSIQNRLNNIEAKLETDNEPVFVNIENRNGKRGITLPGTDEWLEFNEVETSPRCKNVIVMGEYGEVLLWRPKHFTLCQAIKRAFDANSIEQLDGENDERH